MSVQKGVSKFKLLLINEINRASDGISSGCLQSFEAYKNQCGYINGIKFALNSLESIEDEVSYPYGM